MIKFTIKGEPIGKGRPRFYNGRAVTPERTRLYEAEVAVHARVATREMIKGAVGISICAVYGVPKSATKKKRAELLDGFYVEKKPDADNIAKVIMDAISGICYEDDSQVADLRVLKAYTDSEPYVSVVVTPLRDLCND